MVPFEDACMDEQLYAVWLGQVGGSDELAERVGQVIRDGGFTVTNRFMAALAALEPADLADFVAANSPFESDDLRWIDHCRRRYPPADHPSLSAAQRNGARVTWRI